MGKLIILNCVRQQPTGQLSGRTRAKRAEPKSLLQFRRMTSAVLLGGEIVIDGFRRNISLLGDKRDESSRGLFRSVQRTTGITQVTKHKPIAEAVVIAAAALDHRDVHI